MKKILNIFPLLVMAFALLSCSNDNEPTVEQGYLKLEIKTLESTYTRATNKPLGYDARAIYVEVVNSQGTVVASTNDFDNDNTLNGQVITLEPGTYTVNAHSAEWDGTGSGMDAPFYAGSKSVTIEAGAISTANVTLTQKNVKVSVIWDQSIADNFSSASASVTSSISGVDKIVFVMGQNNGSAYFPVSNLTVELNVKNSNNAENKLTNTFNDLSARDHLIITYTLADAGKEGAVNVFVDETTHTYSWTIQIPRKSSISLTAKANAWSNFAELSCEATKTASFDDAAVSLQYKASDASDWTTVANDQLTATTKGYTYKLTGLTPSSTYTYRYVYDKDGIVVNSNEVNFTTEAQTALYNGDFELWHYETNKEIAYPTESEDVKYWSSSNPGSGSVLKSLAKLTDKTTDFVHGGSYAAKLTSKATMGILAAASLYTGNFVSLNASTKAAVLEWGVPFSSRPTSLKGYMIYQPGSVNIASSSANDGTPLPSDAPASGDLDHSQIYCVLMNSDAPIRVDNSDLSTFPNWQTDSRVVAYGAITQKTTQSGWTEFEIPLEYHSLTAKPKYIIIVASASKYGDYFHGSSSSVLYLDDFELVYGDNPTVK